MEIKINNIKQKINNKKLYDFLLNYIEKNHCCNIYPNCTHPKFQSDPNVFENENNLELIKLKKEYFNFLKNMFGKINIIENKCWIFLTKKNEKINSIWHNHYNNNLKDLNQISGLYYVTNTKHGTLFKINKEIIEMKPKRNKWYLWESKIMHAPKNSINDVSRMVLATSTCFKIYE